MKFSVVGFLGTLLNLATMATLIELFSLKPTYASAIAIEISIIHNFLLNYFWTFRSRTPNRSILWSFIHFNTLSLGTLIVNVYVAHFVIGSGVNYLFAQACGILCALAVNYLVNNYLIFNKAKEGLETPSPTEHPSWHSS